MNLDKVLEAISVGDVIGVLAALGAIIAALKRVMPVVRSMHNFLDDLAGEEERPGVPARPGVMQQLADLRTDVDLAQALARDAAESAADASYHSKPNHGDSAYDDLVRKIERLQASSTETTAAIITLVADRADIREYMSEQSEQIRAINDRLNPNEEDV